MALILKTVITENEGVAKLIEITTQEDFIALRTVLIQGASEIENNPNSIGNLIAAMERVVVSS